ncbi:MAG TPA: protein kinase [Bryobacteraceae bacterium]|jgi:serine/threonine-protein kinase|nr:protein kinase [Bryobacteraceae bacterium]
MIGQQLANYRILEKLGEGGMGVVYKAIDLNLDRVVALKLLSSDLAAYPELTERFKSEARLQATLSHPNVALLYTFFFWEGSPAIVMEFIEGETFQRMIRDRGSLPPSDVVPLFKQALMGVGAAHRRGIVHRDIKPANIMLSRNGLVKVMDFGIAKAVGGAGAGLTRTNTAMGTSWYMSPEQVLNRQVDARSDIYSLGVTLYEMLCGQVPFHATSEFEIQRAHVNTVPAPPSVHCPNIPPHLVAAVSRALEKDPDARFQSVEEFSVALGAISFETSAPAPAVVRTPTPVPTPRTPVPIPRTPAPVSSAGITPQPPPVDVQPKTPPPLPVFTPKVSNRRWVPPAVISGVVVAILCVGGLMYSNSAAQERERAREEAVLTEQRAEQQRQAVADQERRNREAAEDQRNTEALKERIREEGGGESGQTTPSSPAANEPSRTSTPDSQEAQATDLSNALGGATVPAPNPTSPAPNRSRPAPNNGPTNSGQADRTPAGSVAGLWKGTYVCMQGQNSAEMLISARPAGVVTALLAFRVPNAKPGSYLMAGGFDQSTGQINLHFTRWINHPLNYFPANLTGIADLRQGVIRGQVVGPGCGNFELWRNR